LHPLQVGASGPVVLVGTLTILAVAQVGSLFSADAWNNVTFTAGEVRNPSRNLPLSLALGTGVVLLLYVLCNVIYLQVLPLDSTANLKLHDVARTALFSHGSMLTNILAGLYYEWSAATRSPTPTLYDPMTLASMLEPSLCPLTAMHITVDDAGNTRETQGAPNAQVCLHSDADAFLRFYVKKVAGH